MHIYEAAVLALMEEMDMSIYTLDEKIRALPLELQREVEDFVEFLLEKRARSRARPLDLSWRGALRDPHDQTTSVELQHMALTWREETALKQRDNDVPA